jgi:hypothetical protein
VNALRGVLRLLGRLTIASVVLVVAGFVALQFVHIIDKNIALAHELSTVTNDVAILRARRAHERAAIVRLSDPRGAIPEIHDRLRLAAPREAIVYLKKAPPIGP